MEKLLTPQQVADLLSVSIDTIYRWSSERSIPVVKFPKAIRFDPKQIKEWVTKNTIKPHEILYQRHRTNT